MGWSSTTVKPAGQGAAAGPVEEPRFTNAEQVARTVDAMTTTSTPTRPCTPTVRALRPDEGDVLDALLSGMSLRSRYLRFHTPVRRLTAAMRRSLLDVDGRDRIALVAEAPDCGPLGGGPAGGPVGIARAIRDRTRPDEAEIAFAVVDAWHRRGVARSLVTALAERARAAGVRRLVARVLPENAAALGLLRALFPVLLTRPDEDALVLVALLDGPDGVTVDDVLADLLRGT